MAKRRKGKKDEAVTLTLPHTLEGARAAAAAAMEEGKFRTAACRWNDVSNHLWLDGHYAEALAASEEAERLDPDHAFLKIPTAKLLLATGENERALAKSLEAFDTAERTEESWRDCTGYHPLGNLAWSILGQAKLALGDAAGAIEIFRRTTSPETLSNLEAIGCVGFYDLKLVSALIQHRLVLDECRAYLEVARVAARSPWAWQYQRDEIDALLAQIQAEEHR